MKVCDVITHQCPSTNDRICSWGMDLLVHPVQYFPFNSSPPRQNGRLFAEDTFRCIFVNEKFCILTKISLKFVPYGSSLQEPSIGLDNG